MDDKLLETLVWGTICALLIVGFAALYLVAIITDPRYVL